MFDSITLMQHVLAHFVCDPVLSALAQQYPVTPLVKSGNYFENLVESIISQQLSVKVSDVIVARFRAVVPSSTIEPAAVLSLSDETVRSQGISYAKIRYIKDLARHVQDGLIDMTTLDDLPDEEVIATLTQVKGIGRWTAEMFLMFTLAREDIFSTGDLGLKRAIQKAYALKREPTTRELLTLSAKWSPYRTYACRILWQSLDNAPVTTPSASSS